MAKKDKTFIDPEGRKWDSHDEYGLYKWILESGYQPELQYKFIPGRKFRADFCLVDYKLIIECWGLDFNGYAGHNNMFTLINDLKRHLLAVEHGWNIIYWCKGITKEDFLRCLHTYLSRFS
jgi:hypothetical protein